MRYIENLLWILDKPDTANYSFDQKIQENIAFVHSLGKKCDSVGWSALSPDDPQADDILEKIAIFCEIDDWIARGHYTREYADFDSDWFCIDSVPFKDNTFGEYVTIPTQDGSTIKTCSIKAYRELTAAPKWWGNNLYVPERFYKAYCDNGMTGLDFCWVKDTGRYVAEQYFEVFGGVRIPRVAVAWDLKNQDLRGLGSDGGWLPRLGQVLDRWTYIGLPYCYKKEDMPAGGIAYAYIPTTFSCCGLYQVLVHKDVAQQLLQEKAIPAGALKPVPVLDVIPSGYTLRETSDCPRPTREYMAQSLLNCERLKKKGRPVWQISEKEALKVLRQAKSDRKEDFGKKLSKAKAEALVETKHAPLLPYYAICNGGYLSDEYDFLSAEESAAKTREFYCMLESEELLEDRPDGVVICTCANGDQVLLLEDGAVIRFSHETPEAIEQWSSLAQFIVDAIND